MLKVAVILSGCGVYDGSEIHEACLALLALDQAGATAVVCAPSGPQLHVVNHLTGKPAAGEVRDILVEAARLGRGQITALADLDPASVGAVLLPGGFGAAKNLCTFATEQDACTVNPDVEGFLRRTHTAGRPIGAMCIAPVVLARVFGPDLHPRLTIGNDPATAEMITRMGAEHVNCAVTDILCDEKNRMITTPAYMLAERISDVFDGAVKLVARLQAMAG
jgi:enhancing lycopene biosynthesis protein 2